jgi:adenosine kinase
VITTGHFRSMCTHLAAANEYKVSHLRSPAIWALVEQASVYFVGGYHLTVCVPAILALAEEAAAKDKIFILSLSAPFIPQFFTQQLDQTAPYWDYLIGNETEARSYADAHNLATHDVREIARYIAGLPKENGKRQRTVVITQGTAPTVVAVQGESEVREFEVHEIGEDKICDTNGAGYVFRLLPSGFPSMTHSMRGDKC